MVVNKDDFWADDWCVDGEESCNSQTSVAVQDASKEKEKEATMTMTEKRNLAADLVGVCRLSTDAVRLTTELVEAQHSRLDWFSNYVFHFMDRGADKVRNPIAAFVYNSIYTINAFVGIILQVIASSLEPVLGERDASQRKTAALAILNCVIGDYLAAEHNPLAISMRWETAEGLVVDDNDKIQNVLGQCSNRRLLLVIHGSCNAPQDWWQEGHNHGLALANSLGYTPLFLHYNTGLHISENGKLLARSIDYLVGESFKEKQPLSLTIIAHSMGGLATRSACHYGENHGEEYNTNNWLKYLDAMITLGSPHHGAILERGGKLVDAVLGAHRYTEPLSWLGKIRSKGVTDLGYGNVRDEDWMGVSGIGDFRKPTPLPKHVRCLAIAAVLGDANSSSCRLLGENIRTDGLVTAASALGRGHENPDMNLKFSEQTIIYNSGHIGMLSNQDVYQAMHSFLIE